MNKCHLNHYFSAKGETSDDLTEEEKSHINHCDSCRDSYIDQINENRKLRIKFSKIFSEADLQSVND